MKLIKLIFVYIPVFIWNFKDILKAIEKMDEAQQDLMEDNF